MKAKLAVSRAGHDVGKYYVVIREEGDYVFLADGAFRTTDRPKRKNRKHIQIIKKLPQEVAALLECGPTAGDLEIKRAIRLYIRGISLEREAGKQNI